MNQLKFTKTHEWVRPEGEDMCIGITEHAQQLLGDLVFIELPEVGSAVIAGSELGVVESVKAAADFYAPINGTITAINSAVSNNPALVNSDPYGAGWLLKIKADSATALNELLNYEQYQSQIDGDH